MNQWWKELHIFLLSTKHYVKIFRIKGVIEQNINQITKINLYIKTKR